MSFQPLADLILGQVVEQARVTAGGIQLPDSAINRKNKQVLVVAVGPGTYKGDSTLVPVNVSVGQTVLTFNNAGAEVEVDGGKYLLLREAEILGVVA